MNLIFHKACLFFFCFCLSCSQKETRIIAFYIHKNKIYLKGSADKLIDSIALNFYDTSITNNFINRNYADCGLIDSANLYVPYVITIDLKKHPLFSNKENFRFFYIRLPERLGLSIDYKLENIRLSDVESFLDTSCRIISFGCRYNYDKVWPNYYYHIFKRNGNIKYQHVYFNTRMFPFDLMTIRLVKNVYIIEIYSKVSRAVKLWLHY